MARRQSDADVGSLRHCQAETRCPDRFDGIAVDRNELSLECPEVDHHVARGRGVDHSQPHASCGFDPHDFGIFERSVVGQIGIESNVVQTCSAMAAMAGMSPFPRLQLLENLLRVAESEIMQHHHMFLLVERKVL